LVTFPHGLTASSAKSIFGVCEVERRVDLMQFLLKTLQRPGAGLAGRPGHLPFFEQTGNSRKVVFRRL
jgi:hypothetical protein